MTGKPPRPRWKGRSPDASSTSHRRSGNDEIEPIREAIRYEARGAMAFGAIAAVASAVFVGQAVARQSRKEWADLDTLRALGISDRDLRGAVALRGGMIGVTAALVAAVLTVALSPLGPIGVGRRAEIDPGPSFDWMVLAVGSLGVVIVVMSASWLALTPRSRSEIGRHPRCAPPLRCSWFAAAHRHRRIRDARDRQTRRARDSARHRVRGCRPRRRNDRGGRRPDVEPRRARPAHRSVSARPGTSLSPTSAGKKSISPTISLNCCAAIRRSRPPRGSSAPTSRSATRPSGCKHSARSETSTRSDQ